MSIIDVSTVGKAVSWKKIPAFGRRPTHGELLKKGRELRRKCPRSSHRGWKPSCDRPSALELVKVGNEGRIPELIPVRHGRMLQSPFTFYRGTALNMAVDLAKTPTTGLRVQVCGDAHLGNFRCFATPERNVIFDVHDLDETLPAPWEWDLKRLAASFVVASRNNGLSDQVAKSAVLECVASYRERMEEYGEMRAADLWYERIDADTLVNNIKGSEIRRRARKRLAAARGQTALEYDFPKLVESNGEAPMIKDQPPLIYHLKEHGHKRFTRLVQEAFASYRRTLPDERRVLLDRFEFKDITIKVVGVGSVGTYCAIILLMASDRDPLFLQLKQANASVLEPFAGKSVYANHGQRVVMGHRLMQSASDVFLGWTEGRSHRQFYIRQLRDTKIKFAVENFGANEMKQFASWCGTTLARAHARSGEPALISGYLGSNDKFDHAIAKFAVAYADQVEKDYVCVRKAARAGKLRVLMERS